MVYEGVTPQQQPGPYPGGEYDNDEMSVFTRNPEETMIIYELWMIHVDNKHDMYML